MPAEWLRPCLSGVRRVPQWRASGGPVQHALRSTRVTNEAYSLGNAEETGSGSYRAFRRIRLGESG